MTTTEPQAAGRASQPSPPPSPLPAAGTGYHQFLRTGRHRVWKPIIAILALVAAFLAINVAFTGIALAIDLATGAASITDLQRGVVGMTPAVFAATNLSLAAVTPIALLLQWALWGQRPRWLSSVTGGLRRRWLGRAALLSVPLFAVYVTASYLIDPSSLGDLTGPTGATPWVLLAVVLLTTPLQATGEEYGARGLLFRAGGSFAADPRVALLVGLLVANVIFMIAHGATDPWLCVYYFVFGLALSIVTWRTGGLEAGIVMHVANNLFALVPLALFGDIDQVFVRSAGAGGPRMIIPMVAICGIAAVLLWWARRNGVTRVRTVSADGTAA